MPGETALVFLHGWCGGPWVWRAQRHSFADWPLLIPDLAPARIGPGIAEAAEAVVRVAEASGAARFILIGHSLGGAVAVEAALRLGGRCRMILGVDSFTDAAFYAARPATEIARRLAPFAADFQASMAEMLGRITRAGGPALRGELSRTMGAAPPGESLAQMRALLAWDIEARWPGIACPTAALLSAPLHRAESALSLPGLVPILMPAVGHFPMLEDPPGFDRHLRALLGDAPGASGAALRYPDWRPSAHCRR